MKTTSPTDALATGNPAQARVHRGEVHDLDDDVPSADLWPLSRAEESDPTQRGKLHWVGSGCPLCDENAAASPIGFDEEWPNPGPPCHPSCDCSVEWEWDEADGDGPQPSQGEEWQYADSPSMADYERAAEFAERAFDQPSADELSAAETRAFDYYEGSGYAEMNDSLRAGSNPSVFGSDVTGLDSALERASTTHDVTVFRGSTQVLGELAQGDRFTDDGYVSTSLLQDTAGKFERSQLFEIQLPKGASAMARPGGGEAEVLLPRGSTFEVTNVASDGRVYVRLVQ